MIERLYGLPAIAPIQSIEALEVPFNVVFWNILLVNAIRFIGVNQCTFNHYSCVIPTQ